MDYSQKPEHVETSCQQSVPAQRKSAMEEFQLLNRLALGNGLRILFQPIIDIFAQQIIGFEMLARGVALLENPEDMFAAAVRHGLLWDIEYACRRAALERLSRLPREYRDALFFLNVSPDTFSDSRFKQGFTRSLIAQHGLEQQNIVIEITEKASSMDNVQIERLARHYRSQGFLISLDDFGTGQASLVTLIAVSPHFIKLDKAFVHNIENDSYKQKLVKSITSFSSEVRGRVIAECVEKWQEMEVLLRLGVRCFQGFLIMPPQPEPRRLDSRFKNKAMALARAFNYPKVSSDETIHSLMIGVKTIQTGSTTCRDLNDLFRSNISLDHLVIVDGKKPVGLVTRQHFYLTTGGPFGYTLFQRKPAETAAKLDPLIVEEQIAVTSLANLTMDRVPANVYDPIIVVNADGDVLGTVTVKQLLKRATELEVTHAMGANPLTNLPGNRAIQAWIESALDQDDYTIVYADLDNFKEYNDTHGFYMGDEIIRFTGRLLKDVAAGIAKTIHVGHLGGDDFVIVARGPVSLDALQVACQRFDKDKLQFFNYPERQEGYYWSSNRTGEYVRIPLVTLSIAVIQHHNFNALPHPAYISQVAASLKKRVKSKTKRSGRSTYLVERRRFDVLP